MNLLISSEYGLPDEFINVQYSDTPEKIHEILLTDDEARHTKEFNDFFVIEPEHPFWTEKHLEDGKKLPEDFRYASDDNDEWITKEELKKIIKEV